MPLVNKEILLVPYWVHDTLKRHQLPLGECLNFVKMREILSLNDLITFPALQGHLYSIVAGNGISAGWPLFDAWSKSYPKDNKEMSDFLWKTVSVLGSDLSFQTELQSRLFNKDALSSQYPKPFEVFDISRTLCAVVIYPGYFGEAKTPQVEFSLIDTILKVLYRYLPYHEVAQSPLYNRYLRLLG